ncbi:MAG: hypothetical protein Q7S19_00965 [bacterium]|nr:hypothetical protein [bacterium]
MKGDITLRALHLLEEATYNGIDLLFATFVKSSKSDYRALKRFKFKTHNTLAEEILKKRERRRFDVLVSRLCSEGLVKKVTEGDKVAITITSKGRERARELTKKADRSLPAGRYEIEQGKTVTIVSYDIPERERRKRSWIRSVLSRHEFTMLHQSTWVGTVQLPEEFMEDLRGLGMTSFVEIFSVSKSGTLKKVF